MESPVQTRRGLDILAISTDSRLNRDALFSSTLGKKRRHDAHAMEDLLKPPIIVKPHPPNLAIKPRSLQPLMLLPREHLALSCLDLSSPQGHFQFSRYYESAIKILDLEGRVGNRSVLLIARSETDKAAYALERQDSGLYTVCKLGSWVNLEQLSNYATVSYTRLLRPRSREDGIAAAPAILATVPPPQESKKRRLGIEAIQSLVKRPSLSKSTSSTTQGDNPTQLLTTVESATADQVGFTGQLVTTPSVPRTPLVPDFPESAAQQTASNMFDTIRNQYFEVLYHSMGSVAYFAKGPLSRARAAFHLDCDSNLEMNDLIDFLKSLVITTIQVDKKYRETIPGIIANMKTHIPDSDLDQAPKSKKKKLKKMKVGKDGLYPTEDEHVRRWWDVYKPQSADQDVMTSAMPQETRLQISCLRSRETQLQMILILEILALEPLRSADTANEPQLPGLPNDEPTADSVKEAPAKKRNKHNFPMLLDVHADRLSIWQSVALDEVKMADDSQGGQQKDTQKSTSDPLRDFCVEVIVPFFSARLPEQCDSLNRKLGGPVMPSPPKSKPKKPEAPSKSKGAKPGGVAKRPVLPKTTRTLERVLSKETEKNRRSMSRGPSGIIALMRSASTSTISLLKREASETPSLANVPRRDSKDSSGSKTKASASSTMGPAKRVTGEEKLKREAQVKAELQEAISSLRKPNREVVVKAMVEADERRVTTSLSQMRKSKKPTQHPRFQNTIKATPTGVRFRDALARDAHGLSVTSLQYHESIESDHAPSSASVVPSSAPRKRNRDASSMLDESPALPPPQRPSEHVQATPAKPSALRRAFLSVPEHDEGIVLASSPVMSRKIAQPRFLGSALRHRDSGIGMPSSPARGGLVETPVKKARLGVSGSLESFITRTPLKMRGVDVNAEPLVSTNAGNEVVAEKRVSIYEQLGWDDYDDLA